AAKRCTGIKSLAQTRNASDDRGLKSLKLRQQAEIAFRKLQAPAHAKDRPDEKGHANVEAHNEKNGKAQDCTPRKRTSGSESATSALIAKRAAKVSTARSAG
ncbi:hypothetical protein ACSV5K_25225, partial [Agrobacterium pusense]|uniref:hypothetical protein n=1 Tax=Agrobacterium pusense TaxID=648995 RepID=UPI003FD20C8D